MTQPCLTLYQVDAFVRRRTAETGQKPFFTGNPAAVVPLDHWLPDDLMQAIAASNNPSETAFFTGNSGHYDIRWFTPQCEVDLCGHATLASAWVIRHQLGDHSAQLNFRTQQAGTLSVAADGDLLQLNFPARVPRPNTDVVLKQTLEQALGQKVKRLADSRDLIAELENQQAVLDCQPDYSALAQLPWFAVAITARSDSQDYDFVSRFFAPAQGIEEDPVTGSSFCSLAPYWQEQDGEDTPAHPLRAWQCSARGGDIQLALTADRVLIAGRCELYLSGTLHLPAIR